MKYIVTLLNGKEVLFAFPRCVNHDYFAEGMEAIRFGDHYNWERTLRDGEIVAAGMITNNKCHGSSETLGIASRPDIDTKLFAAQREL